MRGRILLLLAVTLSLAADAKDDAVTKELARFQGPWRVVGLELNGNPVPEETFREFKLVYTGNKFTFTDKAENLNIKGTMKLDPTKKPKTMDFTMVENDNTTECLAIYELEGDDLKICYTTGGEPRPTELKAKPKSKLNLLVCKRVKA